MSAFSLLLIAKRVPKMSEYKGSGDTQGMTGKKPKEGNPDSKQEGN